MHPVAASLGRAVGLQRNEERVELMMVLIRLHNLFNKRDSKTNELPDSFSVSVEFAASAESTGLTASGEPASPVESASEETAAVPKLLSEEEAHKLFLHYGDCEGPSVDRIGHGTYGWITTHATDPDVHVQIGHYCSIAKGVDFIVSNDHPTNLISTFPFGVITLGSTEPDAITKGGIVIDDDVWIGFGATILDGVHIGQGAVIGARAGVAKDVPPYAIVGGVPAKVIRYRFDDEMIVELMKVDYSKLTDELVAEHYDELCRPLVDASQLDWMPKYDKVTVR